MGARTACPKPVPRVGHRITQVPGEGKSKGPWELAVHVEGSAVLPRAGEAPQQRHRGEKLERDHHQLGLGKQLTHLTRVRSWVPSRERKHNKTASGVEKPF